MSAPVSEGAYIATNSVATYAPPEWAPPAEMKVTVILSLSPVILSEAKNLQFRSALNDKQILRFAQNDRHSRVVPITAES